MAQLVDGKAASILAEFETLLHFTAADRILNHPDWDSLDAPDRQFVLNFLSAMIIQNACSFERRILRHATSFPMLLLGMGKVRHDLPREKRRQIAKLFLEKAAARQLDIDSMKILNSFQEDIQMASSTGVVGIRFYVALKAVRRMFIPHVRENERLNKQLSLYGERAPNASLELLSSRLVLKFFLGVVGAKQEGLFQGRSKKWSTLRPLANVVFDKCLGHWQEGSCVMETPGRFAAPSIPEWCPGGEEISAWETVLNLGGSGRTSVKHIMSAAVNQKLCRFFQPKKKDAGSQFKEPRFCAVAFVPHELAKGRPYKIPADTPVYMLGEVVNRAVRLLKGVWQQGGRLLLERPWKFEWVADLIFDFVTKNDGDPLTVMVFPISWVVTPSLPSSVPGSNCGLQASLRSRDGTLPFVTVTQWEEESRLQFGDRKEVTTTTTVSTYVLL